MVYTIHYLGEGGAPIASSTHKGDEKSALSHARNALFQHQADSARILDESGREVGVIHVDA